MFLEGDINWKQLFKASAAGVDSAAADRPVKEWRGTTIYKILWKWMQSNLIAKKS